MEDFHKQRASREAERNAESKRRAQEISHLLKDDKALKEEIERLKSEEGGGGGGVDTNARAIQALEATLSKHQQDAQRRLSKQELDSELAIKRKLAAGLAVGPTPPSGDPPRRGPGFRPPKPPPFRDPPPPPPPPPLRTPSSSVSPPTREFGAPSYPPPPPSLPAFLPPPQEAAASSSLSSAKPRNVFIPTSVAIQLKKKQTGGGDEED